MAGDNKIEITTPLTDEVTQSLNIGDQVLISGVLYTARDAAHKKMVELLDRGEALPFDPAGHLIYYVGPTPTRPGKVSGSAGPTTAGRMNAYAPRLIAAGSRGMIGKGEMSPEVAEALSKHGAVYFAAVGGAGALIARSITSLEVIAWPELGAEAVRKLEVTDFPAIVAQDAHGGNLFRAGVEQYRTVDDVAL